MSLIVHVTPSIGDDSVAFPTHPFNLGFFSCATNESGFDRVLKMRTGKGMKYIFTWEEDQIPQKIFKPDWDEVVHRCENVSVELEEAKRTEGWFSFRSIHTLLEPVDAQDCGIVGDKEAFHSFLSKQRMIKDTMSWVSFSDGMVFVQNRPKIAGVIKGFDPEMGNYTPTVYLVLEASEENSAYYFEGLEIIKETAKYILSQPNPSIYEVHWKE